jgi:PHD and RING finger domain-containing protein 1
VIGSNSDGDSEKCPICLTTLKAQEVGKPDTCDHLFCMGCLEQWSVNANTCPVDRKRFNVILVRHYPHGEIIRRIPVRTRLRQIGYEAVSLPDIRLCEVCGESNESGRMAYCHTCNFIYHPECVSSRESVTLDGWSCPLCSRISSVFHIN